MIAISWDACERALMGAFATTYTTLKPYAFRIAAAYFLAVQTLVVWALIFDSSERFLLFWYCNNFSFFLAIAAYRNNMQMFKGFAYVGLITQLLWIADFISHLLGGDLSGTADYIFLEGFTFANEVSIILHMTVPIVALVIAAPFRPQPTSLLYAAEYIAALYIATLAGTTASDDVNCVFQACSPYPFDYHVYMWPLYVAILSLGAYAIHELLYRAWLRMREHLPPMALLPHRKG